MAINDYFTSSSIILHSSPTAWETIQLLRYLTQFAGHPNPVYFEDRHCLRSFAQPRFPEILFISPEECENLSCDQECSLTKLPWLCKDVGTQRNAIPYLIVSAETSARFTHISNTPGLKLGIALNNRNGQQIADVAELLRNLPRYKLSRTFFYLLTMPEVDTEPFLLGDHLTNMSGQMTNSDDLAALIASLDVVIAPDSFIAHLAGAMGKEVWLLAAEQPEEEQFVREFTRYYDKVTVFHKAAHESWVHLFLKVSLHRLLRPDTEEVPQTSEEAQIGHDMTSLAVATSHHQTGDLGCLIDAPTPPFINVMIETTSACNLKCSYCPNATIGRPEELMSKDVYTRIIDGIAEFSPQYDGRISPHFFGEPLLDPRIEAFVHYARLKLPAAKIELFTNGLLLTVEKYRALKAAGVTTFIVSQHTPEPSPATMATLNTIQLESPHLYSVAYVDQYHAAEKMNRGGTITAPGAIKLMMRCNAFLDLTFDVHGNSVLCCNDYCSSQSFGNIASASLREIWESPAYVSARNLLAYSYFPFKICSNCFKFSA
jgi:8-amino-3,8-dideoxy-alpha-D-manno-octulosonate transaminase